MDYRRKLSDQQIERLLAGTAPAGSERTDDLARFIRGARSAWSAEPAEDAAAVHVTKAAEAATAAGGGLVADRRRSPRSAHRSDAPQSWRRRTVLGSVLASLSAKVTGVALAATVATTGALAATGSLPASAQQVASTMAAHVGVNIPDGSNHPGAQGDNNQGVTGTVTSTAHSQDHGKGDDNGVTGTVTSTATDNTVNHGNCVSWAAHMASTLGFTGREHGLFVSTIAGDSLAVSAPVADNGLPGAACQAEITKAVAALRPAATPTATATSGTSGHGQGNESNGSHGNSDNAPGHNKNSSTTSGTSGNSGGSSSGS